MKRMGGFTLFELVIVTVLMGVLAISLAPRFMNMQDDARSATYANLKGAFQSAVSLFHAKWLVDGEPNPDISQNREGDWGYTIYNLHYNKFGYPRIIKQLQGCKIILENLLPDSELTAEDYDDPDPVGSGSGNKCIYVFKRAPFDLTYSEENGEVTLIKRTF